MKVVVLDESVASKIAAGEVIERPASVVKELVENALDAGARQIEVEVEQAGRALIRVSDDGAGMDREDAVLALQRHATSKIRSAEDLSLISTLGFRGEALPSIAAVSHLSLVTRAAGAESGVRLRAVGGEIIELEEVGAPAGTQVAVSRLFYNTPARLKFLRSDTAEMGHINEAAVRFVFSHPETALRLRAEGREVIHHAGAGDLRAAALSVWGRELAETLLPVHLELPGMAVRGLVSPPDLHRGSRARQHLFVNRRWVRHRALTHALEEAYRGVLPERRYPVAVLLLALDPAAVDANVHPTKSEVRLSREWEVHHLVSRAVREALSPPAAAPRAQLHAPAALPGAKAARPPGDQGELPGGWAGALAAPGVLSPAFQSRAAGGLELRALAQLRGTYILAESAQGLLLVDQHRAQERVLYERFQRARAGAPSPSQGLLSPAVAQLGPREAGALTEHLRELAALGFETEPFGPNAYLVRAIPAELAGEDPAGVLRDLAEDLASETGERSLDRRRERLLIALSCRSAIKAGDPLSPEEAAALLRALSETERPYTCPHGWPIVMTISNLEIDRKFNR